MNPRLQHHPKVLLRFALGLLLMAAALSRVPPATAAEKSPSEMRFERDVLPILKKHCADCHGEEGAERGLNLSALATTLSGSTSGAVVTPAHAERSLLVQVLAKGADPHMPPDGQLSGEAIATIRSWIDELDASTPVGRPRFTDAERQHWAFQPLRRVAIPPVNNSRWPHSPIDSFILARLESGGLEPSAPADKALLLRRAYFDLIGLPPSPAEVRAFVADESPTAYERVVEQLLASPRYGERWGRHWLDLARYADSSGFHNDLDRPHAWRYRDYVIRSFNDDKPYGRFILEQLAGDQLPDATRETWIATGFGCNGPSNEDNMGMGLAREKYRMDELDDIISTTSNVFLGLTLGCARCHDHKFDPITQRDYYRFVAFFNSSYKKRLRLASFAPQAPQLDSLRKKENTPAAMVLTGREQKRQAVHLLWRGDVAKPGPEVRPGVPEVLRSIVQPLSEQRAAGAADGDPQRLALAHWIADRENPLTWRVMANRIWHYHFGRGLVATTSNFGSRAEKPSHPLLLDWLADQLRRTGSAKSLHRLILTSAVYRQSSRADGTGRKVDPENRLLWRMNKKRLEAEPLRDAFLSTSGVLNLHMGGPGIKPRIRPELLVASQRNKWPLVEQEGPEHWRRSVYVYVKRQLRLPLLELFDAPSSTHSCARREESLVPTQSLVLMNDRFLHEQARHFADRVTREAGDDPAAQVNAALWIALSRKPSTERVAEGVAFLESQRKHIAAAGESTEAARRLALADFCHVLMNLSEFIYVD